MFTTRDPKIPPRSFLGLVVIARAKHPVPSRTRPLSAVAPMVLRLKTWESRSPPNLERNANPLSTPSTAAGWSSPVARQAHNLKAAGSNPAPATSSYTSDINNISLPAGRLCHIYFQTIAASVAAFPSRRCPYLPSGPSSWDSYRRPTAPSRLFLKAVADVTGFPT